MLLIYILILLFVFLLSYQVYLSNNIFNPIPYSKSIEYFENKTSNTSTTQQQHKPYNLNEPNNSLILAQQNAGNIEVLKGRIDNLDGIKKKVDDIQETISLMQTQLDNLVQQQAEYAQELVGTTPPTITGTDNLTVENIEL